MGFNFDDLNDALVNETMSEIADNFFGARIRMEQQMELLESFAEQLRKNEQKLKEQLASLCHLLLGQENAQALFKDMEVDSAFLTPDLAVPESFCLPYLSMVITEKGEYVRYVLHVYNLVQKECRYYMNGKKHLYVKDEDPVYYQMVEKMCDIVNLEIRKNNREGEPGSLLQYTKRFDPLAMSNERIIGGGGSGYEGLNKRMSFQPVDFTSFHLTAYPLLPKIEMAEPVIKKFCKSLYKKEKTTIKALLAGLKKGQSNKEE